VVEHLRAAARDGQATAQCSLDLGRSVTQVQPNLDRWQLNDITYPYPDRCKDRTIYCWTGSAFEPVSRFSGSLIKLVPTEWGAPTFEIDGIKMLPTARVSPFEDALRKVDLVSPRGKVVLDTCAGLGYFAHWCLHRGAARVLSYEKNENVIWLRNLNPWSPAADDRLTLTLADIAQEISSMSDHCVDAILHDPPRFGIAGELYSQEFYDQLSRVIRPGGLLFHYTGTPNKLTSGRDVQVEVAKRLKQAGFTTQPNGDGVLAKRGAR
jgi:predicted methyltransferase